MGFTIQNAETGEMDYIHCETNIIKRQRFDEETGEPLCERVRIRYAKHSRFHIPKEFLRGTMCEEFEKDMMDDYENSKPRNNGIEVKFITNKKEETPVKKEKHYNRDAYMNMEGVKNEILLGYNKNTFRIFLIPSLICFNIYVALLMVLFETFLHIWAHKKNGLNMNKKYYYRSPLHILTSQFCATCRSESEVDIQIFDMLNKQMRLEAQTLRNVTKAIS